MSISRSQMTKQVDGQLSGAKKKKAPKGYHYMPDGKLMKDSEHAKKKKSNRKNALSRSFTA